MELNLILFVIFFISFPIYILMYGKRIIGPVNEESPLPGYVYLINIAYIILSVYLFNYADAQVFLLLIAIIVVAFYIRQKVWKKWSISRENPFFKNLLIVVGKIAIVLLGAYIIFIVVAVILSMYVSNYKEPIKNTDPNVYVHACRTDSEDCYTLKAHYLPQACAPVEYGSRGPSGGQCYRDAYIEKIYFENGGYIAFEEHDCVDEGDDRWLCTGEDGWNIDMLEGIKVKK